jgi:hypothetical protein
MGITDEDELCLYVEAYKTDNHKLVEDYITKKKWK